MESEFDNIKEVEYYDYSRNFYSSDENTTSNSHGVDSKQMRWTPNDNDNLNNIISDEVNQTTTTTTTTTSASTNNGQFDDNLLLNSSDKIDLNQKISPLVGSGDDNSLHHASTLENNGEEFLATGGYDNKNGELLTPTTTTELDGNDDNDQQHQKVLLEKNHQPHHHQQLGDADGDYGPETCVDVTDDVVMMTENSADTNNLSEQSTLSHSKDTLPSSDNCNPFDNKNALDMEETNEFQLGHAGVDAHIQLDDANKATPLLSPEVEDLPLSSDGQMHFTNEGYQQSPLDDDIPVGIGCNQNQFDDEFMQSNGYLSPMEVKDNEVEKEEKIHEEESNGEIDALAKLERFGDLEENEVQNMSNLKPELVENFFGSPIEPELEAQEKEIIFNNSSNDENDFRLKDEEEILEKHVHQTEEFAVKESEALDLSQKEQLQQSLHNLEVDILEEKPILTGNYLEEDPNVDESYLAAEDEEKQNEFADEKQDKEEFSEKEDKMEEKLSFVEQKSTPSEEIELEEDNCIHLEEDIRPSDYLAMLERQKEELQHQHLSQLDEGFEKEVHFEEDDAMFKSENEKEHENSLFEEDNKVSDEMMEKEKAHLEEDHLINDNQLIGNGLVKEPYECEELEKLAELQKQLQQPEESSIDEILENNKLESEVVSMIEEQISLIEDSIVQPEKQCFEEPEKIQEKQEIVDAENKEEEQISEEFEKHLEEDTDKQKVPDVNNFADIEEEVEKNSHGKCLDDQVFDEVEKQLEENTEKQLQDSNNFDVHEEELENRHFQGIDQDTFEEIEKQIKENSEKHLDDSTTSADIEEEPENKDVPVMDKKQENLADSEDESENSHLVDQTFEEVKKQLEENTEKQTQDSNTMDHDFNVAEEEKQQVENMQVEEDELNNSCLEDIDKQVQDLAEFVEDLENKHSEELKLDETEKLFGGCTEEQLQKIEQQVLDAAVLQAERSDNAVKAFEEPEIDPENMEEVEEPIIVKEQVPIKSSVLAVSAQEPSAVQPTHESCDESEDDEWKYTKENQGEKQLGLQGDTVVEEELPQDLEDAGVTFSINERKASGNILQQQISINTSNLIESINDTCEDLTKNITELADEAASALTEIKEEKTEQGVQNLNLSQSSTREKLDNIEDEEDLSASEMNSRLNPEAKEFVPTFSPPSATTENGFDGQTATAIPHHFKDELISQSPRKGRESNMEDINIPAENEFEEEIAHKPHGLLGDEAITEPTENGSVGVELFQEMNWKEAMHGSEKEEGPLVDSPVTEESLEVVDNQQQLQCSAPPNVCELSAPVDLDNAGMKQSIYIENNTSNDDLNHVQVLPIDDIEIGNESPELLINKEASDAISNEEVQEILTLAGDEKIETKIEEEIEQKMEQLLLNHDQEFTKDVKMETEEVTPPINGVEMAPEPSVLLEQMVSISEPVSEPQEPSAPAAELAPSPVPVAEEAHEGLGVGAAIAVVAAATTTAAITAAAVKKVEDEKNQKNLKKTSSATKSKVPDTKKPAAAKTSTVSSIAAKRTLADKPKPAAAASSLATKKTTSSTTSAAPRPRAAPAAVGAAKTTIEKKPITSTTSTVKSRIDAKTATTLATRKPISSSATRTTTSKPGDETKSSSSTVKSSTIGKSSLGSKPLIGSTRTSATNSTTKPRPATATSAATTNGTASKTAAATKPTTLAPKSAAKPLSTSPRGTLTSTLRKTEAVKSPTKTTSSTITSRISTNGVTKSTTTTRTTTTKTTSSTVPATTRTTTSRLSVTGTTTGSTTPTSKTNNLLPRKSTPLKKTATNSSTTPIARKSIGSKLNSPATKPTKDTSTPRPVTIPAQHQNQNSIIAEESKNAAALLLASAAEEPKLNGNASPDDVSLPSTEAAPVAAHPLIEMETA